METLRRISPGTSLINSYFGRFVRGSPCPPFLSPFEIKRVRNWKYHARRIQSIHYTFFHRSHSQICVSSGMFSLPVQFRSNRFRFIQARSEWCKLNPIKKDLKNRCTWFQEKYFSAICFLFSINDISQTPGIFPTFYYTLTAYVNFVFGFRSDFSFFLLRRVSKEVGVKLSRSWNI